MNSFNFTGRVVSFGFARLQNGKFAPIKSGQQGLRQTNKGTHFIRFTVAIDRKQRDRNGNRIADFAKMSAWKKTADYLSIMNSGDLVAGTASFRTNHFQGRDGKTHYSEGFVIDPEKIARMSMSKVSQQQYQQHKQSMQNNQGSNNMFGNNQMNNGSQMNNQSNQPNMNMNNNNNMNQNMNMNNNNQMNNNQMNNMNNGNRMMNNGNNQSQRQFNQPNNNGNQNIPANNGNKKGDNGLPF